MAKAATRIFALQRGRTQPFLRTLVRQKKVVSTDPKTGVKTARLVVEGKPVQMKFDPDVDYELTAEEQDLLATEISTGMLVPSVRDEKGRLRRVRDESTPDAEEVIAKLEKQVEELSGELTKATASNVKLAAENEQLKKDLEAAKKHK